MFCPQCGAKLPDDSTFCGSCGTRLGGQQQQQQYQQPMGVTPAYPNNNGQRPVSPAKPAGKKNLVIIIVAVVVAVLVIGGVIFGIRSCTSGNIYSQSLVLGQQEDAGKSEVKDALEKYCEDVDVDDGYVTIDPTENELTEDLKIDGDIHLVEEEIDNDDYYCYGYFTTKKPAKDMDVLTKGIDALASQMKIGNAYWSYTDEDDDDLKAAFAYKTKFNGEDGVVVIQASCYDGSDYCSYSWSFAPVTYFDDGDCETYDDVADYLDDYFD